MNIEQVKDFIRTANKEGLASLHNNPLFPKTPTRNNPELKELIV